jgi:hypothetical protein
MGPARRLLVVARHLECFAATADALESGRVGWAHAEILAHAARDRGTAYAVDEGELLDVAGGVEPEELERQCRLWRARSADEAGGKEAGANEAGGANDAERRFQRRGLSMRFAFDGSCQGRFTLDADAADIVARALATPPDPVLSLAEPRSLAQRQADMLVEVCEAALADASTDRSGGSRASVDVVIDVHTLAGVDGPIDQLRSELSSGAPITGPGLDRLLCDASFRALITDGPNIVLAYNRATPDIPPGLRRAVRLRDRVCQFHGCDRPWQWCDLHHLVPRHRGGPTTATNLTLVCRHHHNLIHEGGWQLTRAPDGSITTSLP